MKEKDKAQMVVINTTKKALIDKFRSRMVVSMTHKGLNNKDIARVAQVSAATVTAWVKGTKMPTIVNIYLIAKLLDVPPTWLSGLDDAMDKKCGDEYIISLIRELLL